LGLQISNHTVESKLQRYRKRFAAPIKIGAQASIEAVIAFLERTQACQVLPWGQEAIRPRQVAV
jgi:hypothetical protein